MATSSYKVGTHCSCKRPQCPEKISNRDPDLGIPGYQPSGSEPDPTSQRTMQKIPELEDRPEESMARVRAAEYLNTTAEQYAAVANELLVFRQQRQAKLTEQLRLMGAVPDAPFDTQVVRGMSGGRNGAAVRGGGSWRRGRSWTRRRRRNETDPVKEIETMAVVDDDAVASRELRRSCSSESLARTVNSTGEKVSAGSVCEDTMPYAPTLESVEPPYCGS